MWFFYKVYSNEGLIFAVSSEDAKFKLQNFYGLCFFSGSVESIDEEVYGGRANLNMLGGRNGIIYKG